MSDQVGVKRQHEFTIISDSIIDDENLSGNAKLTFLAIARFANKERTCFPSLLAISTKAGLARSTVQKAIDELVHRGYLKKENRKKGTTQESAPNVYTIIDDPGIEPEGIPYSGTPIPCDGTRIPYSGTGVPCGGNEGIGRKDIQEEYTGRKEEESSPVPVPVKISEEEDGEFTFLVNGITAIGLEKNPKFKIKPEQLEQLRKAFCSHGREKLFELFKEHEARPRKSAIGDIAWFLQDIVSNLKDPAEVRQAAERKAENRKCPICGGHIPQYCCSDCTMDFIWRDGVREFACSPYKHVLELQECGWAEHLFKNGRIDPKYLPRENREAV